MSGRHAPSCDLAACQRYAAQISVGRSAGAGAVLGALFGAAVGVLVGDNRSTTRFGAAFGAADGALASTGAAIHGKANVVRNCMAGRGYRVLQ